VDKETIKLCIRDGQDRLRRGNWIERELHIDHAFLGSSGKVAAILGPRRVGKTFMLFQVRAELALPPERVSFLDFSDLSLRDFRAEDFELLGRAAAELEPTADALFLFDEIQEVTGFEAGIRHLQNKGSRVYLTGSNSAVFGEALASSLRGKLLPYELYPLSFREFQRFKGRVFRDDPSSEEAAERRRLLDEYLLWGGFPEVVLAASTETKRAILDSYIDVMVYRDVVDRHGLAGSGSVDRVLAKLLASFTKEYSVHRWYNEFKSMGLRVGKDSLYDIVGYLEEALVLRCLANAASPGGARKAYLVDNGYYRPFLDRGRDYGKLWENALLIGLLRRGEKPAFWRNDKGEIDLVIPDAFIQATIELSDENRERETAPFALAAAALGDRDRLILTPDDPPDWF
jgi:predicted AAA+ superfamily ATPase